MSHFVAPFRMGYRGILASGRGSHVPNIEERGDNMTTMTKTGAQPGAPTHRADDKQTQTVWGLFDNHAQAHPRQTAIVDGEMEIDYGRLRRRAMAIAGELVDRGVEPGWLVGVCMDRTWELMATLLGVARAGCAYVPLDPTYPQARVRHMLEHARVVAAIVDHTSAAELCEGVPEILRLGDVDDRRVDTLATDGGVGPSPGDLAYVLYTSGSTGQPKGVAVEHRSVVSLSRSMRGLLSDDELSGVLAAASVCFDASVMEILGTLSLGGTVILAKNSLELLELPAADRVSLCVMVPSAMKVLLAAGQLPKGLRTVVFGAEVLTRSLVDQLLAQNPGRRVINVYGPTEDTVYSTTAEISAGSGTITIGESVPGSRAYVLDESMRPVPVGVEGELYLAGDKLARGYLHDEERTRERFLGVDPTGPVPEERLYKTGDLCRRREDGELEFLGRIDQQVKIRGHRVELEEIESTLEAMDGVDAAAAVAQGEDGQAVLVGYVVSRDGTVTGEAARAYLAERLPGYMVPRRVGLLEDLPRLPNDKLDRKALLNLEPTDARGSRVGVADGSARDGRRAALLSAVRSELASILGLQDPEEISPDDSVYDLGLDSLTQVELSSRLGVHVDRQLSVSAMAECSTPAALADHLLAVTGGGSESPSAPAARGRAEDTLRSFQTQIQGCYPPFLAGKSPAWSATDKGTLVRELKHLVSRPGDPFCKLVRTGSGHRGVVADVDTDRAREAIIWTTNLYLGLNRDPKVIEDAAAALARFGTGMGTSAAASGITDLHVEFEQAFADLVGMQSACLFPTGYTANMGAIAGLLGKHDVIVMDQLCHASIVDGARLCGAKIRTFKHNNPADLEAVLATEASPYRTILVVIEGVYSMGEGAAPVAEIARTAKRYDALLLVDEAHSFGFYGPRGAGICAEQGATDDVDFIMTTLSKALGSLGGVVAAREEHVALLKASSRAFIFQASTSPADMAAALAALHRLSTDDSLRERLWDTTAYMRKRFAEAGYDLGTGDGPIVTPHFYDKEQLFAIVNGLFERGIHTSAVTYPIVESGRGRLRFICSAAHSREDVDNTLDALIAAEREAEAKAHASKLEPEREPAADGRPDLGAWAEAFAEQLRSTAPRTPATGPNFTVAVTVSDDTVPGSAVSDDTVSGNTEPITLVLDGTSVSVGGSRPEEVPFCTLRFTDPRAASTLCAADVQGLLECMLDGTVELGGQVEPFIWLVGRLVDGSRDLPA